MGRYTENTEPISDIWKKNDSDTDVGIWNTEKIPSTDNDN